MRIFEERRLDSRALPYIRDRLAMGKSIAKAVAAIIDLDSGSVVTLLPGSVPESRAYSFKESILPMPDRSAWRKHSGGTIVPIPNLNAWLADWLGSVLGEDQDRLVVFEDWTPQASDPFWDNQSEHRAIASFLNEEVYYVVLPSDDANRIRQILHWAKSAWPGALGLMTQVSSNDPLVKSRDLTHASLAQLAARTEALIVGAYDGESHIIWSKA